MILPISKHGLSEAAFMDKTGLLVSANAPGIIGNYIQLDPVKVEFLKAIAQHELNGFGAVTLILILGVADYDTEGCTAICCINFRQARRADQTITVLDHDTEYVFVAILAQ